MKKILTIFLTLSILFVNAQNNKLTVEISRENYSKTEIYTQSEKYILTDEENTLSNEGDKFEFSYGKGGEKDLNGIKERQKKYLLNASNDTIATVLKKENNVIIGNTVLNKEKSEDGWKYVSENGVLYCNLKLFWNKEKWKYEIDFKKSDIISNTLEKVVLLSLIDTAIDESNCDSSSDDSSLWISLYACSILSN